MNDDRMSEVLSAHAEELMGNPGPTEEAGVSEEERRELASLLQTAALLHQSMIPMHPSTAFVHTLRTELVQEARRQITRTSRLRRGMMIGTAVVGSIVSVASVVAAVVLLVGRLHTHHRAQAAPAPTA